MPHHPHHLFRMLFAGLSILAGSVLTPNRAVAGLPTTTATRRTIDGPGLVCQQQCPIVEGALLTFPDFVRRYSVITPIVDQGYAGSLAQGVFNFSGSVSEDAFTIGIDDGYRRLVVYKASGEFEYQDDSKLWNPSYVGPVTTRDQAVAAATSFLQQHALLPSGAAVGDAHEVFVRDVTGSSLVVNHWVVSFDMSIDARAGTGVALSAKVEGHGITVYVGSGEIIGLAWKWRTLVPDLTSAGALPAFNIQTALSVAQELYSFTPVCPATTTRLVYTLNMETRGQLYAVPSYVFFVMGLDDGITTPATSFSPAAVILTPSEGGTFVPDSPLTFSAAVFGGSPPYTYSWMDPDQIGQQIADGSQNPTDILGTTNPLTVTLCGGYHAVRLVVSDANGLTAAQEVSIRAPKTACGQAQTPRTSCPDASNPILFVNEHHLGWTFNGRITANDGLMLSNVTFHNRMAENMELPYYWFQSDLMDFQACQLRNPPGGNEINCVSHLQDPGIRVVKGENNVEVQACYCVDHLPDGPRSGILSVCQVFIFWGIEQGCDPLNAQGDCVKYLPEIQYHYDPPPDGGNGYKKIQLYQRFDFDIINSKNRALFFKDPDEDWYKYLSGLSKDPEPPGVEFSWRVAIFSKPGERDNYHQRDQDSVIWVPGCVKSGKWNCAHVHWRWGAFLHFHGDGSVLPPGSQSVTATMLRNHDGEIDPPLFDLARIDNGEFLDDIEDFVFWNTTLDVDPEDKNVGHNDWFFK